MHPYDFSVFLQKAYDVVRPAVTELDPTKAGHAVVEARMVTSATSPFKRLMWERSNRKHVTRVSLPPIVSYS